MPLCVCVLMFSWMSVRIHKGDVTSQEPRPLPYPSSFIFHLLSLLLSFLPLAHPSLSLPFLSMFSSIFIFSFIIPFQFPLLSLIFPLSILNVIVLLQLDLLPKPRNNLPSVLPSSVPFPHPHRLTLPSSLWFLSLHSP